MSFSQHVPCYKILLGNVVLHGTLPQRFSGYVAQWPLQTVSQPVTIGVRMGHADRQSAPTQCHTSGGAVHMPVITDLQTRRAAFWGLLTALPGPTPSVNYGGKEHLFPMHLKAMRTSGPCSQATLDPSKTKVPESSSPVSWEQGSSAPLCLCQFSRPDAPMHGAACHSYW